MVYDYVFIGMGASNTLLMMALCKRGLLKNKSIAVIEPDAKSLNDKTYCFWADSTESIVADCQSILFKKFETVSVKSKNLQKSEKVNYYYIQSIDLYKLAKQRLQAENTTRFNEQVLELIASDSYCQVFMVNESIKAKFIFDSRPISYSNLTKADIVLKQSFIGYHIRCEKNFFDVNDIEMMNFNIDQDKYTQFIYTIPLSKNEALIELTRFGDKLIEGSYANEVLDAYIKNEFGTYKLINKEIGCIPMTTYLNPIADLKNVLNTGTRANMIKPSTGYGFKNMYAFAENVAEQFLIGEMKTINQLQTNKQSRFYFYDTLLLIILRDWPAEGKHIFTSLFKTSSIRSVLNFLDEKSSIQQEIFLFLKLPIIPFLKALFKQFLNIGIIQHILSLIFVLFYFILNEYYNSYANLFMVSSIVVGLLIVGIPHGSLDQYISKNKNEQPYKFITKYFLIVLIYFTFWNVFPLLSLIVFLTYSSFHFGESELVYSNSKISPISNYLISLLLGASILTFIVSTHVSASLELISYISRLQFSEEFISIAEENSIIFSVFSFLSLIMVELILKLNRLKGLLLNLFLGLFVPLPMAFGLYFIAQHSLNAWTHIQGKLKLTNWVLYKKAFPFTIAAVILFFTFLLATSYQKISDTWAYFFIFIACISLPHFVLMHLFYKNNIE